MKIAVIIDLWPPVVGGSQTHAWEISSRLVEDYDCEVDIFTRAILDDNGTVIDENEDYFDGKLRIIRVGPATGLAGIWGRISTIFTIALKVRRMHKKDNYDFIHAHSILGGAIGKLASILISRPVIFTVHGSPNMMGKPKGMHYLIEKAILTRIKYSQLISVGKEFSNYGNVNSGIEVIPNGVPLEKFDKVQKVSKGNSYKILFVGRLDWPKGLSVLFQAVKKLKENNLSLLKGKKVEFHLVGYGFEIDRYKRDVTNYGLNDLVFFRGKITGNGLIREYKSSDLFLLPSICEGQPVTILEAMAAKLPILTTFAADNSNIVTPDTGWKINAGDPDVMTEKIVEIIQTPPHLLEEMGKKGHKKVFQNFTWDIIANETVNCYKSSGIWG